jgi:sigma-B regulation protein RsbU (phosphoserine phosphatase)
VNDLERVLAAFRDATGCEAALCVIRDGTGAISCDARTAGAVVPDLAALQSMGAAGQARVRVGGEDVLVAAVSGPRRAWLSVGPCASPTPAEQHMAFLLPVVSQYLQSALEVEHAATELAERYEEINLLYTISEILGRTVSMEEAAQTILAEVSDTVGARRAAILVHDRATDTLRPVAVLGAKGAEVVPIAVDDPLAVSARVFRERHSVLADAGELETEAERSFRRGAILSVPIMWTAPAPRGPEPLGVVNLSDRRSGLAFTAGDQKLMAAIATQIGTAIQNARLVRASVDQQRLAREMQLAHELQMKLLPPGEVVAPDAQVAARVVPAESVGGDFYNLFRLGGSCTGVMIGDVSGHGYQAALIMALTMSASAIHAQATADPGATLHSLFNSLHDELSTTEMFISAFYGIVDPGRGELRYANNGHPHAFVLAPDGSVERLAAADPPLGMTGNRPATIRRRWEKGEDLLFLFTDGVSDARNRAGDRLGEDRVLETAVRYRASDPAAILRRVFDVVDRHAAAAPLRDDLTVVVLRS